MGLYFGDFGLRVQGALLAEVFPDFPVKPLQPGIDAARFGPFGDIGGVDNELLGTARREGEGAGRSDHLGPGDGLRARDRAPSNCNARGLGDPVLELDFDCGGARSSSPQVLRLVSRAARAVAEEGGVSNFPRSNISDLAGDYWELIGRDNVPATFWE